MDFPTVLARLNDLPSTFRRTGPPYTQLIDSVGFQLAEQTNAADATSVQVAAFGNALDGWLNIWGLLWGVPRAQNEANSTYATRISRTVLAWVGTLPALQQWIAFYAPGGSVTENVSGLGYSIALPTSMSPSQVSAFLTSLNRIRPAGVPFTVSQGGTGIYLGTSVFLATGVPKGAYLSGGTQGVALPFGASTLNSVPLLPTLYFSDPNLGLPGLLALAQQGPTPPLPSSEGSSGTRPQFWSNGGVLTLLNPFVLVQSPSGLSAGAYWSNDGEVAIVPGGTPSPGVPIYLYGATLAGLISAGSESLPTSNPGVGSQQLWNDGGVVAIS